MSWNLFEKILSVFNPKETTNQPSEPSEQWPESSKEDSWQDVTEQPEASQEPSPSSPQTSCSLQSEDDDQSDDSDQPKNNDCQQE